MDTPEVCAGLDVEAPPQFGDPLSFLAPVLYVSRSERIIAEHLQRSYGAPQLLRERLEIGRHDARRRADVAPLRPGVVSKPKLISRTTFLFFVCSGFRRLRHLWA